jgi:magnesium transporter
LELDQEQPISMRQLPIITLRERWASFSIEERISAFMELPRADADAFFLSLSSADQAELIFELPAVERRIWVRILPPDDLADVLQSVNAEQRYQLLSQLDSPTRKEVTALLAYGEDEAGGLMNPRFSRVRPDMLVDEALEYVRRQAAQVETTRYVYVLDARQVLLGIVSLRHLFVSGAKTLVKDVMKTSLVTASETMSQEEIKNLFSQTALNALPIVDQEGAMKGIVTLDDIVDVVEEEATEDIQRLGGTQALDAPYLKIGLGGMIRKRAPWLIILFLGEMLTASAMSHYEDEIARAVVLALFIPLIISSGGNSGSQASTLVVRAIALGEVRLSDWWKVFTRELIVGTVLGAILGTIGILKIAYLPTGDSVLSASSYFAVALSVGISLLGVVLWGSLCGSMLPFALKRLNLDPATASAPFVATLVDVSGLIIYFTVAGIMLKGSLL